jgi:hypothetical protein
VFNLGVELGANQDRQAGEPEPEQQDDDAADRAVGLVVIGKAQDVEVEPERNRKPRHRRENRFGRDPDPFLFRIRREVIDDSDPRRDEYKYDRPLQDPPAPLERLAELHPRRELLGHGWSSDHQRDRRQDDSLAVLLMSSHQLRGILKGANKLRR